ncbi:MAG: AI-2E family transporter [Bacteroidota bacterium]
MNNLSRYIALAFSLLLIGFIFWYFSDIVAYVLIAWVLSLIGQPFMRFFQARIRIGQFKAGPSFSAFLTLISYILIFTLLVWMFIPLVVEQASNLVGVDYNAITQALDEPLSRFNAWLGEFGISIEQVSTEEQVRDALSGWFEPTKIGNFFGSLLGVAGNLLFSIFSILFITFFFLKEQGLFVNFLVAVSPNKYAVEVRHGVENITRLLTRYFGGVLLQMTIITIFVSIGLSIFGVRNALLIGFFAAVINVIPYLGPIIGAAFGIFITISSNLDLEFYSQMMPLLLKVLAVFAAMQMLDNFVLQPFIFSSSVLAHPLEIFIIILIGAKLDGIVGMILAIPAYTVLRVVARVFLSEFKIVQKLTGSIEGS